MKTGSMRKGWRKIPPWLRRILLQALHAIGCRRQATAGGREEPACWWGVNLARARPRRRNAAVTASGAAILTNELA